MRSLMLWVILCSLLAKCGLILAVNFGTNISPPNGTAVYGLSGTSLTFKCLVVNNETGVSIITDWRVNNIDVINGVGTGTVNFTGSDLLTVAVGSITTTRNVLTIEGYNLNDVTLTCENGGETFARYYLFLYRPVSLQNFTTLSVLDAATDISVSMENASNAASPFPTSFSWTFNGNPSTNGSSVTFSYPTITFHSLAPSLSGSYSLSAMNFFVDEPNRVLGSGVGSFMLDVLFGPTLTRGDSRRAIRLGDPVSLVCGTQLQSNPDPTISWRDPRGDTVIGNNRVTLINDMTGVRLNFFNSTLADNGMWTCNLTVTAQNVNVPPNGDVVAELEVGQAQYDIELLVVDAPGQPTSLAVEAVGGTWVQVDWVQPSEVGLQGISHYTITVVDLAGASEPRNISTPDSSTMLNVTDLLPVTNYSFTVRAVSSTLGVEVASQASDVYNTATLVAAPAPFCRDVESTDGGLDVSFGFLHTGGQELSSVDISYAITGTSNMQPGPNVAVGDAMATIPRVVAGNSYTIYVTAANMNGSMTARCPPVVATSGLPQAPAQISVEEDFGGSVVITAKFLSPGSTSLTIEVEALLISSQEMVVDSISKTENSYNIGDTVTIKFEGAKLMVGSRYRFRLSVRNSFGAAASTVLSDPVTFMGTSEGTTSQKSTPAKGRSRGGLIGGVVVAVVVVFFVVILSIALSVYFISKKRRHHYTYSVRKGSRDDMSGSPPPVVGEKASIDIGMELSEEPTKKVPPKEITYADLDNFAPPKPTENTGNGQPAPVKSAVARVEYASIDSFRRDPEQPTPPEQRQDDV